MQQNLNTSMTYYNEFDPNAAAWIKQLCNMGLIANGHIDDRSIIDVKAEELTNYERLHFFAGIGGWDYALQLAGWPAYTPIVTASLPCQPFSAAGKGLGQRDERHLLPHFIELVKRSNWPIIVGEQVPNAIAHGWLDDLQLEMGKQGYAVGSCVLTAAGAGAPHIRKRIYWAAIRLAHSKSQRNCRKLSQIHRKNAAIKARKKSGENKTREFINSCNTNEPADTIDERPQRRSPATLQDKITTWTHSMREQWTEHHWINCADGKQRPIKPGILPLANGLPKGMGYSSDQSAPINEDASQEARVMRIKGYGNAIVPQVAAQFLTVLLSVLNENTSL